MSSLPGFIKVSFEFEKQPNKQSKIQAIKRDLRLLNKNATGDYGKGGGIGLLPKYNPNGKTKMMPVAQSIRPLPRRSVNIQRLQMTSPENNRSTSNCNIDAK